MSLDEILIVLQNRVLSLKTSRASAFNAGDLENVVRIDNDLITTENSIEKISKKIAELQT
jgi:hypothetical protein